jgi:hypothetical protein
MDQHDLHCRTAQRLMGRWLDDRIDGVDASLFEQHLVVCPPCLDECGRLRVALGALRHAAQPGPPG